MSKLFSIFVVRCGFILTIFLLGVNNLLLRAVQCHKIVFFFIMFFLFKRRRAVWFLVVVVVVHLVIIKYLLR